MIAFLLGMIGLAFALNGMMMLSSVQSALHQQVVAIYLVGGALVFGLAVIAARAASMVDHLAAMARDTASGQKAEPAKAEAKIQTRAEIRAPADQHMIICPSCGRENPPNATYCTCGINLRL